MAPVRPATDDDAEGVIDLIARVFAEYPGCVLDVDREEPELRTPASAFDRFWVVEESGTVVGCIACALHGAVVELKKLYLDEAARGRGLARQLVQLVEKTAHGHDATLIELWSDTRFTTAHAVYEHLGYARTGRTRDLHDLSNTTEYHFVKHLRED
ncbi:MAG: GNAT family N-acetyltransferase [Planctomycetota bacterium]|jgi:putative acetyltransferase